MFRKQKKIMFFITTLLFASLFVAIGSCSDSKDEWKTWKTAAEHILTSIQAGPLGDHFTPDYIATRTKEGADAIQRSRLRGEILLALQNIPAGFIHICNIRYVSQDNTNFVMNEFKNRTFNIAFAPPPDRYCEHGSIYLFVPIAKEK